MRESPQVCMASLWKIGYWNINLEQPSSAQPSITLLKVMESWTETQEWSL